MSSARLGRYHRLKMAIAIALPLLLLLATLKVFSWRPQILEIPEAIHGHVYSVAFSSDGRFIAAATNGADPGAFTNPALGEVHLWDAKARSLLRNFSVWNQHRTLAVALAADGKTLACSGENAYVKIFDADTGKLQRVLHHPQNLPAQQWLVALRFLPHSKLLAVGDMGGNVELWNTETGAL